MYQCPFFSGHSLLCKRDLLEHFRSLKVFLGLGLGSYGIPKESHELCVY